MMLARVADSLYWVGRYVERAEHLARLTAQSGAQGDLGAQQRRHAGHPEALATGVQVNLLPLGIGRLDRNRQQRRGREHDE